MKGLWRWCAKNRTLAKILLSGFLCVVYTVFLCGVNVPLWAIILVDILLLLINYVYVETSGERLMQEPMKARNERCDPNPLLLEIREQMTYRCPETRMQVLQINHALALRDRGEFQKALEILQSVNIDQYPSMLPVSKVVYYNNLSDALMQLGRFDEAEVWYQKSLQIYKDMPENKLKKQISDFIYTAGADAWYRRGEYARAIECLDASKQKNMSSKVDAALVYARCCIALGQTEKAREKLQFVVQWGNKMFHVTQAKELLEQLP